MSVMTYSPFGLRWLRNKLNTATNAQLNTYWIKAAYASAIGFGDPVITLTSGNAGYIGPYSAGGTAILGVFFGLLPYYDLTLQGTVNKNFYAGTENPSGDIQCLVCDDPFSIYLAQCNGGPVTTASRGLNIDMSSTGAPNGQGLSTAALNYSTVATTSSLPLRITGWSQQASFQYDPTAATSANQPTNNYVEVTLNPGACESLQGTGI